MLSIVPKTSFYPDDGTLHVSFERPYGFGPFAWRLVDDGVLLRRETLGAEGEYFLPFSFLENWRRFSLMVEDPLTPPYPWHAQVGTFYSDEPLPEGWLGTCGEPFFDDLWRYLRPSEREGAPAKLQVDGSLARMGRDGIRHFTVAPAFPGPFSARLLPDDGWILLESPGLRPVCVDLIYPPDPDNGFIFDLFRGGHFKKGITEVRMGGTFDDYHGQTPYFSTLLEFPDGWDDSLQRERYARPDSALSASISSDY